MSGSSGIGQLFKGVIIGIVLLLAIVGTMSILDKGKDISNNDKPPQTTLQEVPAPSINVASSENKNQKTPSTTTETQTNTDIAKQDPQNNFTPTLENEKPIGNTTPEVTKPEDKPQKVEYGMLELTVMNPVTKASLKADYVIYDESDAIVAESKNTEGTSIRLPTGKYKVITTLIPPKTTRKTNPVQTTQFVTVIADKTSTNTFELEPASTTGVLQVSAVNANNGKPMKANFIVQKENGENVATRQNITASLFKLTAGSYKVTVRSGNNSDFRTIVVEPGESTQEVFKLTEAYKLGRVLVRIFDTKSNRPASADIVIQASDGTVVQKLKAVSKTEISLPAANYKIIATGDKGRATKAIRVIAGQDISEIFRFEIPVDNKVATNTSNENTNETQITDNVIISGVDNNKADNNETITGESNSPTNATLELVAKNEVDQRPIRSNFYIQTLNGKNIAKKIYATSAEFDLPPGRYKVTIRSKNRKNIVKNIEVFAGQRISQSYSLIKPNSTTKSKTPTLAPPKPAPSTPNTPPAKNIDNGFLYVAMNPARKTHFVITSKAGKKIVELTSVPNGNFKLDVGQYVVTAIHNNIRKKQTVRVRKGKTTRLVFNAASFNRPPPRTNNNSSINKGVLRSRIVNRSGQPLRGDLTITNNRGQVVARANAVTVGIFDLAPGPYTVILNYRGLRGNERVNIIRRETTVQTFTIAPNNASPQNTQTRQKSIKELLKEKLEKELRKQF